MDKCVLIVDDNDFNRELVKDILEDEDITVYEAEDGSSAIELLESEQSDDIDVVLMDMRMPGMDGIETTKIIRTKNGKCMEVPIIAMTADGFETDIGQRGIKLSGGQKQRISIARVFLKNPPILIFDEATSALDNESEKIVQESMEKLAKNRTTMVIAHRLSTIRNAEKILVLTDKGIEEQGTHKELMDKHGIYYDLYNVIEK